MKKALIVIGTTAALLAGVLSPTSFAAENVGGNVPQDGMSTAAAKRKIVNEIEPNDSFTRATNFSFDDYVDPNDKYEVILNGEMSSESDYDIFRFVAPKTGNFTFDVAVDREVRAGDMEVLLSRPNGYSFVSKKLNSRGRIEFDYKLTEGEIYYIEVDSMFEKRFGYTIYLSEDK
ncbi:hypothetical protein [Paenibacillus alvei]|uniref:hypothetical protein n=1 Tax=Paenibacillus alvei TaxID=44250 RepID=UPI002280107B|nr:hypothetical protein [Paenibacillus alvei]